MKQIACLFLAITCLAGCSGDETKDAYPHYIIYSPNAEPLNGGTLGHPTCNKALSGWFDRVDAGHAGFVDRAEFMEDAKAQFARMDIDKNGFLVSEELERYREPFRQPAVHEHEAEKKHLHKDKGQDAPKHKPVDQSTLIDPVMSADNNLDFKVSRDEFLAQANKNFTDLDADHNGSLRRDEVLALCKKPEDR